MYPTQLTLPLMCFLILSSLDFLNDPCGAALLCFCCSIQAVLRRFRINRNGNASVAHGKYVRARCGAQAASDTTLHLQNTSFSFLPYSSVKSSAILNFPSAFTECLPPFANLKHSPAWIG